MVFLVETTVYAYIFRNVIFLIKGSESGFHGFDSTTKCFDANRVR